MGGLCTVYIFGAGRPVSTRECLFFKFFIYVSLLHFAVSQPFIKDRFLPLVLAQAAKGFVPFGHVGSMPYGTLPYINAFAQKVSKDAPKKRHNGEL